MKNITKSQKWYSLILENKSYKFVSLIIALILWMTILGRRDFTLSKNIDVEVTVSHQQVLVSQSAEFVRVRFSGPHTALKKFTESGLSQLISVDVSEKGEGEFDIEIPVSKIEVPFGVRVESVKPSVIRVKLMRKG